MKNFWLDLPRPFLALAPMEDVTDKVFRPLVAQQGRPAVQFTEFVSAESLVSAKPKEALEKLEYYPSELEIPLVAQLWGTDPEAFRRAAALVAGLGFSGIDINMGCPVKKIAKKGACSALIGQPALAAELIQAVKTGAPGLPVSVKTRLGVARVVTEDWCSWLLHQGLAALTIHGRIADQQSEGVADWQEIAKVLPLRDQLAPSTRLIGNGDLTDQAQIKLRAELGLDGLMIGRGVFQDLAIFNTRSDRRSFAQYSTAEKLAILETHIRGYQAAWGSSHDVEKLKRFYKIYTVGFAGDLPLREALMETHGYAAALAVLEAFRRSNGL